MATAQSFNWLVIARLEPRRGYTNRDLSSQISNVPHFEMVFILVFNPRFLHSCVASPALAASLTYPAGLSVSRFLECLFPILLISERRTRHTFPHNVLLFTDSLVLVAKQNVEVGK